MREFTDELSAADNAGDDECIFDSRGIFTPLADTVIERMAPERIALYQTVADAFNANAAVEKRIELKTKELHAAIAELRAAEEMVRTLPKRSHLDLVREMSRQTRVL